MPCGASTDGGSWWSKLSTLTAVKGLPQGAVHRSRWLLSKRSCTVARLDGRREPGRGWRILIDEPQTERR